MADHNEKRVILNKEAYNLGKNNQASPILCKLAKRLEKLQRNFEFCQPQSGEWKKRQQFEKWIQSGDFVKWMNNEESI